MPRLNIVVRSPVMDSFRVRQIDGLFDLSPEQRSTFRISAELPGLDQRWTIGAIVGASGTGKTLLAKKAYEQGVVAPGALVSTFDWPAQQAVVDGFDEQLEGSHIAMMLKLVGFSSPPSWRLPWRLLSRGQQFRCDLARALLLNQELVVMDEFTSMVDRQVAQFGSAAMAKALRTPAEQSRLVRCKRFVAVSCHEDMLAWLSPDWTFHTTTGQLVWGSVRRPSIELELCLSSQKDWPLFANHHYLSRSLNPASRCYTAKWNGQAVAFCATMHQSAKLARRRVHRLVVLPDYQGMGIGLAVLDQVAQFESSDGSQVSMVTSHPTLVHSLSQSARWQLATLRRSGQEHQGFKERFGRSIGSMGRATVSFLYQPKIALGLPVERSRRTSKRELATCSDKLPMTHPTGKLVVSP